MTLKLYLFLIRLPLRSRWIEDKLRGRLHRQTQRWRQDQFKEIVPWKEWRKKR